MEIIPKMLKWNKRHFLSFYEVLGKGNYSKNVKLKEVMFSFFLMSIRREGIIPKMSKWKKRHFLSFYEVLGDGKVIPKMSKWKKIHFLSFNRMIEEGEIILIINIYHK